MSSHMKSFLRRLHGDRRGAAAVLVAIASTAIIGFGAAVVDIGYVYHVRQKLQAAVDVAALAGAMDINNGTKGQAITTATTYSSVKGGLNADPNVTATMVSGYPVLKCFSSTGISCTGADSANAIIVKEQATVSLFFARIFGRKSLTVTATAVAGSGGGKAPSTDIMVILDATGSMGQTDSDASDPACKNQTREQCALLGVQNLLAGFTPPTQQVGLMTFPGYTSAKTAAHQYCHGGSPSRSDLQNYSKSPVYQIVGLSNDYKTGSGSVNQGSDLAKAAGEINGCIGIKAFGGESARITPTP